MNPLSRFEHRLWKSGFLGSVIRALFRAAWARIRFVPDAEKLWRALHKPDQLYKETGRPKPSFFRDVNGLSCDLARFSSPQRSCAGHGPKPYPAKAGLVEFSVERVRAVGSDVGHRPVKPPLTRHRNYGHAQFTSVPDGPGQSSLAKSATFRIRHRLTSP